MGKMKALSLDMEENHVDEQDQQQQDDVNAEFDVVMEEMHYHHTINDFVYLVQVHGWNKVIGDLRSKMGQFTW